MIIVEPVSRVTGEACIRLLRRNQCISIILMSVVGAEFGQEMAGSVDMQLGMARCIFFLNTLKKYVFF